MTTIQAERRTDDSCLAARAAPGARLEVPRCCFRIRGQCRLLELMDRATRRRLTLLCAPAGAGKTVACSAWAAARARAQRVVWVTLASGDDQAWLWASVCTGLKQAGVIPEEAADFLEDGPADAFPLRLAEMARMFGDPVAVVLDNMDYVTSRALLTGLDTLACHGPQALHLVLCSRRLPGMRLDRLRASGDLAEIGAASLTVARSGARSGRPHEGRDR